METGLLSSIVGILLVGGVAIIAYLRRSIKPEPQPKPPPEPPLPPPPPLVEELEFRVFPPFTTVCVPFADREKVRLSMNPEAHGCNRETDEAHLSGLWVNKVSDIAFKWTAAMVQVDDNTKQALPIFGSGGRRIDGEFSDCSLAIVFPWLFQDKAPYAIETYDDTYQYPRRLMQQHSPSTVAQILRCGCPCPPPVPEPGGDVDKNTVLELKVVVRINHQGGSYKSQTVNRYPVQHAKCR